MVNYIKQAQNTDEAVQALDGNIEALRNIVENENENKSELENAMLKINNSYENVENASKNILKSLRGFNEVKRKVHSLKEGLKK